MAFCDPEEEAVSPIHFSKKLPSILVIPRSIIVAEENGEVLSWLVDTFQHHPWIQNLIRFSDKGLKSGRISKITIDHLILGVLRVGRSWKTQVRVGKGVFWRVLWRKLLRDGDWAAVLRVAAEEIIVASGIMLEQGEQCAWKGVRDFAYLHGNGWFSMALN